MGDALWLSIVCGLVSAAGWGVADWLARGIATSMGSFRAQLWSQAVGAVVLFVAVVVSGAGVDVVATATPRACWFAVLYAALIGAASLCFFEAFGKGAVAVVAPIVGSYGAVTVAWSLAFGSEPSARVLTGLVVVIAGVVVASIPARGTSTAGRARGTIAAVVAAVLFGTAFFVLGKEVVPTMGSLVPALLSRLVGPTLLTTVAVVIGVDVRRPPRDQYVGVVGAAVLAAVATVATGIGARGGDSSVVAVLGSLSVVVTVVIAVVVLRERLAAHQKVGVVVALIGLPLLAL